VAAISSRIAERPYRCPFCGHLVHSGQVIAQVVVDSTYSSGCLDCAWAAQNKVSLRREAAS
jgi:transcription elongation factor Elf1